MAKAVNQRIVFVTCGSLGEARKIAGAVVASRLAACVNISSAPVQSIYRWKGRVEVTKEFLLIIKTTASRLKPLEKNIKALHSYDVPEFLVIKVASGSGKYLAWITANT
jgi:periplasmic divalent cation tolerance protein